MLILAITSSTSRLGCAVGDASGVKAAVQATRQFSHAELLASQISVVCDQAGVTLRDVTTVAVDVGPGLYTGLRVGLTTAVSVAYALQVPMIPVSSVQLVAFGVRPTRRLVVTVIDAKRGEVFWAFQTPDPDSGGECQQQVLSGVPYENRSLGRVHGGGECQQQALSVAGHIQTLRCCDGRGGECQQQALSVAGHIQTLRCCDGRGGECQQQALSVGAADGAVGLSGGDYKPQSLPKVATPAQVSNYLRSADKLVDRQILLVGDGAIRYASEFVELPNVQTADAGFAYPSAEVLAIYATQLAVREAFVDAKQVKPLYLRRPDAQPIADAESRGDRC